MIFDFYDDSDDDVNTETMAKENMHPLNPHRYKGLRFCEAWRSDSKGATAGLVVNSEGFLRAFEVDPNPKRVDDDGHRIFNIYSSWNDIKQRTVGNPVGWASPADIEGLERQQ